MLSFYLSMLESAEDQSRFEAIYLNHRNSMFSVALSILHNQQDAEDAIHNVFLSVAEHFTLFSQKAKTDVDIKNYLLIAVKNKAIDQLRERGWQRDLKEAMEGKMRLDADLKFEKTIETADDYQKVVSAIQLLHDRYKQVLYLNLVMEFDAREIAKLTKMKPDTVRKQIYRGKKQLLKILQEGGDHHDE